MLRFLLSCAATAVVITGSSASAETRVVDKEVTVTSGESARIGIYGRVTPECTNAPVDITLEAKALNGTVTAKEGRLSAGAVPECPSLAAHAAAIFYKSAPGFVGNDRAAITVTTDEGRRERHEYSIIVERKPGS